MESYDRKKFNYKDEEIQQVTDFQNELERIKAKLANDFTKFSEIDKYKNSQKLNILNDDAFTNNNKAQKEQIKNVFNKIPTMEELKIKYGLSEPKPILNTQIQTENKNSIMKKIPIKPRNRYDRNSSNNSKNNNRQSNLYKQGKSPYTSKNYFSKDSPFNNLNNLTTTFNNRNSYLFTERNEKEDKKIHDNYNPIISANNKNSKLKKINDNILKTENNTNYFSYLDSRNFRQIENLNNTSLQTSLLNSKLEQQLKLIDEKSEINRLELEKTQLRIKEIETSLKLDERLTHKNREIRKNALKELGEMCQNDFNTNENKEKAFEYFSPWIKYCLEETNSYVIPESLNFYIIFNTLFPNFLYVSFKDFFDNIERYVSFGINSINESCIKIIFMYLKDKKLYHQAINELIKLLEKSSSSLKMIKLIQEILIKILDNDLLQENYLKIIFEKAIKLYIKTNNKNIEKKKLIAQLINILYSYIDDDYQKIKNNLNIKAKNEKELDILFNKLNTTKGKITFTLYPNKNQRIFTDLDYMEKNNNIDTEINENDFSNENFNNNNNNNFCDNNNANEINDIVSVLPNEFFEYHLAKQFQAKINILEKANNVLNKIVYVRDKEKNLIDVYKIINYSILDSNILIHLEGIKLLENICRLINEYINLQKLKILLQGCFEKLKDKKSLIKNELFALFNIVLEYQCFEINKFILFILQYCSNNKNDNSIIKLGLFEFIKILFLQQENKSILQKIENITEKEYLIYTKLIASIIEKESSPQIKNFCTDLLIIFKKKICSQAKFFELIQGLSSYRKKIIETEENNHELTETNYKKFLKKIKSNYSYSNIHSANASFHKSNSRCESLGNSEMKNSNRYNNLNSSSRKKYEKLNVSMGAKERNNKLNFNRSMNNKNNYKYKSLNTDSNSFETSKLSKKKLNVSRENSNISNNFNNTTIERNKNNNNTNMSEALNQRKVILLKSIENINEDSIDKYSKLIIKDFLVFIKKICENKNEDLSCHIELIFQIYEKILNRIVTLMNENTSKEKIAKSKKLIDELMSYITKVLILTPCIQQVEGSTKFNVLTLEKYLSIFKNFCFSKEKFYMHILLNLYKFCGNQDQEFPKCFNPKPSAIFYLNYAKHGYIEINSKNILNILKEFIAETEILDLEEKDELLEGIEIGCEENEEAIDNNIDNTGYSRLKFSNSNKSINEESNVIFDKESDIKEDSKNGPILLDNKTKVLYKNNNYNINSTKDDEISSSEEEESTGNKFDLPLSISTKKEKINSNNKSNKTNDKNATNKIKKCDFDKIRENIKLMSQRLNMVSKSKEKDKQIKKTNNISENNYIDFNKSITNNNSPNLSLNNQMEIQKNFALSSKPNIPAYIQTINNLIKTLNNQQIVEEIFDLSTIQFLKLKSFDQKLDYVSYLKKCLENPSFFKNTSINICLGFYNYLLTILAFEILKYPNEEKVINILQSLSEHLLKYRKLNDMFKVLLFLLKKYFPKDLNNKIEQISLVLIKIIAYLLKELLKNINKEKVNSKDILSQINDLFNDTPPSKLTTLTPNATFYQGIFTLLKSITDQIINQDKSQLEYIINYLNEKKIVCDDYMQYLIRLNDSQS